MSLAWSLAAVPLLILMNAFFVGAEYAMVAARGYQVEALRARGYVATAAALAKLKENPAGSIGAIQVCITMTNLLLGWIGEPAMSSLLQIPFGPPIDRWPGPSKAVSTGLSFIVVTLLTVVLSELLPKALTLRFVQPVAVLTAVPMLGIKSRHPAFGVGDEHLGQRRHAGPWPGACHRHGGAGGHRAGYCHDDPGGRRRRGA